MDIRELAYLKKNHNYNRIAEYGDSLKLDQTEDSDVLIFVAEAYFKNENYSSSIEWYKKALALSWEEVAAVNLVEIYIRTNDAMGLEELTEILDKEGIYEATAALARYEYARCTKADEDELIAKLHEYISQEYNESYMLLLAELYIRNNDEAAAINILKDMQRLFPTGLYMQRVSALQEALHNNAAQSYIEKNSIENELYCPADQKKVVQQLGEALSASKQPEEKSDTGSKLDIEQAANLVSQTAPIVNRTEAFIDNQKSSYAKTQATKSQSFISLGKALNMIKQVTKKIVNEEPMPVEERFQDIVGMIEARERIGNLYRLFCLQNDRKRNNFHSNLIKTTHFAICGKEGCGKTTLASILGKLLYDFGIREVEEAVLVEAKDLEKNLGDLLKLSGTVLIIENIEKCRDNNGSYDAIAWPLRCLMYQHVEDLSVIITGSQEGIQSLFDQESEIKDLIYDSLYIPDYSIDDLIEIATRIAHGVGFELSRSAIELLRKNISREYKQPNFRNGKAIEQKIFNAAKKLADRYAQMDDTTDEDMALLVDIDFELSTGKEDNLEDLIKELDHMTGLNAVKDEVHQRIKAIIAQRQAEIAGSTRKGGFGTLHMVFQGGPGTGKTTVARIIGKIYQQLDVLPGDVFVECTRKDLVAAYVGQTAKNVQAKIKEAMGGVLFIDEAYSLCNGDNDQFGKEAVDTLIAEMENSRDSLMVIFAGYTSDMNRFLNANEGLRSRISRYINFEDYSVPEMVSIYKGMVKAKNMYLDADTQEILTELMKKKSKLKDFGNARGVRNLLDKTIDAVNDRVTERIEQGHETSKNEYDIIRAVDIKNVLEVKTMGEKSLEELMEDLNLLTGLASVKDEIRKKVQKINIAQKKEKLGVKRSNEIGSSHMIFKGNPGTGKTTVARLIGSIYRQLGILPEGNKVIECSRSDLVSDIVGRTAKCVKSKIEEAMGGVLFIDEAYTLSRDDNDTNGQEAIDALLMDMEEYRDSFMVILAGYTHEMDHFLTKNPGLSSRISNQIIFEDYTIPEMVTIWKGMAINQGLLIQEIDDSLLEALIKEKSKVKDFGNARGIRNVLQAVTTAIESRLENELDKINENNKEDLITVKQEDIIACMKEPAANTENAESLLAQLYALTGLTSVKAKVTEMVNMIKAKQLMCEKGIDTGEGFGTLHLVFKGNAGTGKTTVARLIGKIYGSLGVLRQGDLFIECSRQDLVAGYMGQTAGKVIEKVKEASGGILFIDEAYTLKQGDNDSFGQEAITTLLAQVENRRDELMVIIAGYSKDMDDFLATNQGLKSRFANEIIFEDYSIDEMLSIYNYQARKLNLEVPKALIPLIRESIEKTVKSTENFGNARGIRNLVEKTNSRRMVRIAENAAIGIELTADEMKTLTESDIV